MGNQPKRVISLMPPKHSNNPLRPTSPSKHQYENDYQLLKAKYGYTEDPTYFENVMLKMDKLFTNQLEPRFILVSVFGVLHPDSFLKQEVIKGNDVINFVINTNSTSNTILLILTIRLGISIQINTHKRKKKVHISVLYNYIQMQRIYFTTLFKP